MYLCRYINNAKTLQPLALALVFAATGRKLDTRIDASAKFPRAAVLHVCVAHNISN